MATLLQLETFMTVVEQGGFTAASRRLGLSQPAVSRAVAALERDLGLPLLVRRREGLSLTEAGVIVMGGTEHNTLDRIPLEELRERAADILLALAVLALVGLIQ